jgi:REP element-mobilizing transposase RayT
MPRKPRLEFEGAIYHVISRGNYRSDVFAHESTKAAFLKCLDEACIKAEWVIHAWCVMSNHYHLCLETPRANLVQGMRWLQATFAVRFNRRRNERGHLFQGRYQALPVAPEAVGAVCHYIHLNPVRAGLSNAPALAKWPWTSAAQLMTCRPRPPWLSVAAALEHAGGLDDSPKGRKSYLHYLGWLQEDDAGKRELEFERMAKDWAVGTREFKKELITMQGRVAIGRTRGEASLRELAEELWSERLAHYLAALRRSPRDVATDAKGAAWKTAIAAAMKSTTTASNPWLAERLHMGSPFRLSRLVSDCRQYPERFQPHVGNCAKCKV